MAYRELAIAIAIEHETVNWSPWMDFDSFLVFPIKYHLPRLLLKLYCHRRFLCSSYAIWPTNCLLSSRDMPVLRWDIYPTINALLVLISLRFWDRIPVILFQSDPKMCFRLSDSDVLFNQIKLKKWNEMKWNEMEWIEI